MTLRDLWHRLRIGLAQDPDHLVLGETALLHGSSRLQEPSSQVSAGPKITGQAIQRFVLLAVEFDLVVQRAEDVGDGALFGLGRQPDIESPELVTVQSARAVPGQINGR